MIDLDGFSYLRSIQNRVPLPGNIPKVPEIDMYGGCLPKVGRGNEYITIQMGDDDPEKIRIYGGDHLTWVDFEDRFGLSGRIQREKDPKLKSALGRYVGRGAFILTDVAGHGKYEPILTTGCHHAALLGIDLSLRFQGDVTPELFAALNDRFYKNRIRSGRPDLDTITLIYAEMWAEPQGNGTKKNILRYISAGNPAPLVFSTGNNKLRQVGEERRVTSAPLGLYPSQTYHIGEGEEEPLMRKPPYAINELVFLGPDLFIFGTDGFFDHSKPVRNSDDDREFYAETRLEQKLAEVKSLPAREIWGVIRKDMLDFASQEDILNDDITFVIVKRK